MVFEDMAVDEITLVRMEEGPRLSPKDGLHIKVE